MKHYIHLVHLVLLPILINSRPITKDEKKHPKQKYGHMPGFQPFPQEFVSPYQFDYYQAGLRPRAMTRLGAGVPYFQIGGLGGFGGSSFTPQIGGLGGNYENV